ncbi:hypothetical protein RHGRI_000984 [Rhododendron griersonianum]|uniref:Uncharacterized protein n=1 Tax=Rhododendron griersonianum TaxID=479676 RepID=A0AAV6LIK6_9ERIC|nr:hypothetical protein RHGRI_000984 [Rhododendron griersonianum]
MLDINNHVICFSKATKSNQPSPKTTNSTTYLFSNMCLVTPHPKLEILGKVHDKVAKSGLHYSKL